MLETPAGLSPVPATTPRLHAARRAAPKKPKKKGTLSDALHLT